MKGNRSLGDITAARDVRKHTDHLYLTPIRTPQLPVDKVTHRIFWECTAYEHTLYKREERASLQ